MKHFSKALLTILLMCTVVFSSARASEIRTLPIPQTASSMLQSLVAAPPPSFWNLKPKNAQEWKDFSISFSKAFSTVLPQLREQMGVTVVPGKLAGVPIFTITPKDLPTSNQDRILLHFHGGGYVLGAGESGTQEAILMAGIGKFKVISVDYRMAPDFPYPAAIDDAIAVYKELLKTKSAKKIGVFGSSTGGGMSLVLVLRAKAEKLPLPAAIGAGSPWTDLTKTGDTYFTNEKVDNILVAYEGWIESAAKIYAGGHDLKDPMLSPIYGDVKNFPPTLLTTGTRDLFLSNTVRMHLKLREAKVKADLIVFEAMSHVQYHMLADAPETKFHFTELSQFFSTYLK